MALGEISVQVVPDLSKFLNKLSADLKRATNQIDRSTEKVAENVEESFRETGRVVDRTFDDMRREADQSLDGIARSAETNADKLERSFKDAARDSDAALGNIGGGFAGLGAKIGGALAAIGLTSFLKDATLEAEAANNALKTTVQLIESTGNKAGVSISQIENLSKELLFKIGIDDTDVIRASNVLLTFTGVTGNIFEETIARAADLQAVFGTDLSGAAMQLGKALNDPVRGINALRRSGVSFTKEQTEQIKTMVAQGKTAEAQRLILDELGRQFGGTAEASASATKRIGAYFGELKESVGAGLLPAIEAIAPSLISLLQALQGPMEQFGAMFGTFLTPVLEVFTAILPDAVQIFGALLEVVGASISALAPVIEPLVAILADVAEAFGHAFVDLLTMAQPLIEFFVQAIGQAADTVLPILFGIFEDLAPIIGEVLGILGRLAQRVFPVLLKIVEKVAPVIGEVLLQVLEALVPVFEVISEQVVYLLPVFSRLGDLLVNSFRTLAPILPVIAQAFIRIVEAVVPLIPQLMEIVETLLPPLLELFVALTPLLTDLAFRVIDGLAISLGALLRFFQPLIDDIGRLIGWLADLIGKFETVGEVVSRIFGGIKMVLSEAAGFIAGIFDGIREAFRVPFMIISRIFNGVWNPIKEAIGAIAAIAEVAFKAVRLSWENTVGRIKPPWWLRLAGAITNIGRGPAYSPIAEPVDSGPMGGGGTGMPGISSPSGSGAGNGLLGTRSNVGLGGSIVTIGSANFYNGTDATLVAQKVYTAMSLANAA